MSASSSLHEPWQILLVEDNRADVVLVKKVFAENHPTHCLHVVTDGDEAMAFLRAEGAYEGAPRPHLVLLDLNLPGKDGREVLADVKADSVLRRIPVIVLTSSQYEDDLRMCYDRHANAYMTKPMSYGDLVDLTNKLISYWFSVVQFPPID